MIARALEAGGLDVNRILSADDVRVYKTDPRVYALLDAEADRARTLFISSNGWDADGARRDSRTVAWIDRGGEAPATAPNYRIVSLSEVVAQPEKLERGSRAFAPSASSVPGRGDSAPRPSARPSVASSGGIKGAVRC